MRQRERLRLAREPQQTWWVVYDQHSRRPWIGSKGIGSGARYSLQTFLGTIEMVEHQFGASLSHAFEQRGPALEYLNEMNIIDSVQSS
jgi:hypothetical protein